MCAQFFLCRMNVKGYICMYVCMLCLCHLEKYLQRLVSFGYAKRKQSIHRTAEHQEVGGPSIAADGHQPHIQHIRGELLSGQEDQQRYI